LTLLGFVPLALFVFLAAPLLINLIYGSEYQPAVLALRLLIWTIVPMAVGNTYGVLLLIPAGYYKQFFWGVAAGALGNIVLNFILIPHFSFAGAALATIMAEGLVAIVAIYFSRRITPVHFLKYLKAPVLVALCGLAAFALGSALGANLYLSCSLYAIVCALLALLIEKKFILEFVAEIRVKKNG
jgi:O-antigen/teichoic acid export membrane protein